MKKILYKFWIFASLLCYSCACSSPSPEVKPSEGEEPELAVEYKILEDVPSGGSIELNLPVKSDIWYMITNTERDLTAPVINRPSGITHSMILGQQNDSENDILISNTKDAPLELTFYDDERAIQAVRKYTTGTVNTAFGERTLSIYQEKGLEWDDDSNPSEIPTDDEYRIIANLFLTEGDNNDIYDKLTSVFGSDCGYFNATNAPSMNGTWIPFDGNITLLYYNIREQGPVAKGEAYEAGYYDDYHNFIEKNSNQRSMIFLNAYTSGGPSLGNGLLTLSHEFQHLLHAQYCNLRRNADDKYDNPNLINILTDKEGKAYTPINEFDTSGASEHPSVDEMFSSMVEEAMAQWIYQKLKQERKDVEVRDPFYVSCGKGNGYLTSDVRDYSSSDDHKDALTKSMGSYFLKSTGNTSFGAWPTYPRDPENDDAMARYNQGVMKYYGLVASFAHYLLVNYGMQLPKAYLNNSARSKDLDGIVAAINTIDKGANMTVEKLIRDWGLATFLSKYKALYPYKYNNGNDFFTIDSMKIPSVNMWLYATGDSNYNNKKFGFVSLTPESNLPSATNNFYRVAKAQPKGTYSATAPTLSNDKLKLTVISMPSE